MNAQDLFPRSTRDKDLEHMRILSIFHYAVGGLLGLLSCFPFIGYPQASGRPEERNLEGTQKM